MSFTQAMQPRPTAQPMPAPAGGAPGGNPIQAKFEATLAGSKELIQILAKTPGVDQGKLKQAVEFFSQGMQLLAAAIPKQGQPPQGQPPQGQPPQ